MTVVLNPVHPAPLFDEDRSVGAHVTFATRILIVIMNLLGFSMSYIMQWTGRTQLTIKHWIDRFEQAGNVLDAPRTGRPHITSEEVDAAIVSAAEEAKFITPRVIRNQLHIPVSKRTVRRRLDEAGLFGRVARFSWPLSQDTIDARLAFANDYGNWDGDDWSRVLFTDECNVWLQAHGQVWVQRPEDAAYLDEYMVHRSPSRDKVSIWAGFSATGVTRIHMIDGNLNAPQLVGILASEIQPYVRRVWGTQQWYLLQDNSPIHQSNEVSDWFDTKNIRRFDFPAYSPDLNPMENLWAWLKRQLDQAFYTNVAELRDAVVKAWNNIPVDILFALVKSMPDRLEAVRVQRGFKTKY
jgi:transposase